MRNWPYAYALVDRNPLPSHVDLVDIHIRTLRRSKLQINLQRLGHVLGTENIFNLVSGFLGPLFGKRPAEFTSVYSNSRGGILQFCL